MTHVNTNGQQRSVRHRGASVAAVTVAVIVGFFAFPSAAQAVTFSVDQPDGSLFSGPVSLSGGKDAGSYVQVDLGSGTEPYCIDPASGSSTAGEAWGCSFSVPDGTYTLRVAEFPDDPNAAEVAPVQLAVRVLGAPTITSASLNMGLLTGSGMSGASIRITATGAGGSYDDVCTSVQSGGSWTCPLPLPSGDYDMTAQQLWPGTGEAGGSTSASISVDREAPRAPVISSPSAGDRITTQPFTYTGTGEEGARVDVFLDAALACSATVTSGVWGCSLAGVPDGDHSLQALQWDLAGNPSASSAPITITVGAASVTPPVTPETPATPAQPEPAPAPEAQQPQVPAPSFPLFPPPVGGESGLPPLDTWGTPTNYGAAIPPVTDALGNWTSAVLLGVGFVLLAALPLRLLVTTLRGRVRTRARLAGRNRLDRPDDTPIASPWVTAAGALGAAIVLAVLAGGVQAEVRYLRLVIAVGIALVIFNGLAVALATKLSGRALGSPTGVRLVPALLGAAAVSALFSRAFGIQPPIIIGVVIAATFAAELDARGRGLVSLVQLAAMIVLGFGAWVGQSALGPVDGFAASLASETLSALCISALGSALVLLLPIAGMPGRYVYDWSRTAWLSVALAGGIVASGAIAGGTGFPTAWLVGVAALLAAVSVATWAWISHVEPLVRAER